MKKILVLFAGMLCVQCSVEAPIDLAITAQSFQPLTLLCAVDGRDGGPAMKVAQLCAQLLNRSGQLRVTVQTMSMPSTKQAMDGLVQQGYAVALFIAEDAQDLSWHLYDTLDVRQLAGKKMSLAVLRDQDRALFIASQVFQTLMNQADSFASLIVACKRLPKKGRTQAALCLIHPFFEYTDFAPVVLVGKGNNFGPRWHKTRSVIFYSQHMPTNIRLMSVDAQHVSRVITNFDGQNMTPAVASDGRVVLALSTHNAVQLFNYQFDQQSKKSIFTQITHEKGDCISPSFLNSNELVFCNIDEKNVPRIGILSVATHKIRWLISGALCPMASPDGRSFAYCKRAGGLWQIFVYTVASGAQRQLTHDTKGHKDECSWSPCGRYLTCSVESGGSSRIAVVSVADGQLRFVTPVGEYWNSPYWSPVLNVPFVFV